MRNKNAKIGSPVFLAYAVSLASMQSLYADPSTVKYSKLTEGGLELSSVQLDDTSCVELESHFNIGQVQQAPQLHVRIAAAEALYYNRLNGSPLSSEQIEVLTGLVRGEKLTGKTKDAYDDFQSSYFMELMSGSQALQRMEQQCQMGQQQQQGAFGKSIQEYVFGKKVQFKNVDQYTAELAQVKQNEQFSQVQQSVAQMPGITHEEMFRILEVFPKAEQGNVHQLISKKVFTKMNFYSDEFFNSLMDRIDVKLVARHLALTGNPFWMGADYHHRKMTRYLREVLKNVPSLSSSQLVHVLRLIPKGPVKAESEKELLALRDKLRVFTGFKSGVDQGWNEWTASDLYSMEVPINLDLMINALELVQKDRVSLSDSREIQKLVKRIMDSAKETMHDIAHNPDKPHMLCPEKRNIWVSIIEQLVQNRASKLIVQEPVLIDFDKIQLVDFNPFTNNQ